MNLVTNIPIEPQSNECNVESLEKGDLSSLKWVERMPYSWSEAKPDELIRIHYGSLNFHDVMLASGKLTEDSYNHTCIIGLEYSGISTSNGRRVMGMCSSGALGTHIKAHEQFTWEIPDNWTLAEGATVPVVYATVYTAFFLKVEIQKGKKILIHSGTGGVGFAAIQVALSYGLEVFTTVSTPEKKNYLLSTFPKLKASHIGNSRDLSFYDMVMLETNGEGVDYVLNSLSEDKLITSLKCLGGGGHFLEIGKFDMMNDSKIGLGHFMNEIDFHTIMVDNMFHRCLPNETKKINELITRDIKEGIIIPLKTNIFPASQVEQAFRLLASGKHMGKVLLQVRETEKDKETFPIQVIPRTFCNPNMSYVIVGGLGGFGLELADWFVSRGCKKLLLSSSRGVSSAYQAYRIK